MSKNDTDATADDSPTTDDEPRSATAPLEDADDARADLAARVELLEAENRRLREEYGRARRSQYRATALGLAGIGVLAGLGGVLFPDAREVLLALAATGLFGGLLTYFLTPTRFVAADVGERVYAAAVSNLAAVADELGLRDERLYVPGTTAPARLYVPQHATPEVPDDADGPIVVDEDARGLLLETTGAGLFAEFERATTGDLATTPPAIAAQLTDALVEQFELVDGTDVDLDAADGRATVAIDGSAFGDVDRFDHPIPAFLATGFAAGLERPIDLEVTPGDDRADWLITCRWSVDEGDGENESADR